MAHCLPPVLPITLPCLFVVSIAVMIAPVQGLEDPETSMSHISILACIENTVPSVRGYGGIPQAADNAEYTSIFYNIIACENAAPFGTRINLVMLG